MDTCILKKHKVHWRIALMHIRAPYICIHFIYEHPLELLSYRHRAAAWKQYQSYNPIEQKEFIYCCCPTIYKYVLAGSITRKLNQHCLCALSIINANNSFTLTRPLWRIIVFDTLGWIYRDVYRFEFKFEAFISTNHWTLIEFVSIVNCLISELVSHKLFPNTVALITELIKLIYRYRRAKQSFCRTIFATPSTISPSPIWWITVCKTVILDVLRNQVQPLH